VVEVGTWHGEDWFINDGLKPGEKIVVDGAIRVVADVPLKITPAPSAAPKAAIENHGDAQTLAQRQPDKTVTN
jgi:membrane fusion protein (multidrug efflux system)